MAPRPKPPPRPGPTTRWLPALVIGLAWSVVGVATHAMVGFPAGTLVTLLARGALMVTYQALAWAERRRWSEPVRRLARELAPAALDARQPLDLTYTAELGELIKAVRE